jgi:hypothetical protein
MARRAAQIRAELKNPSAANTMAMFSDIEPFDEDAGFARLRHWAGDVSNDGWDLGERP